MKRSVLLNTQKNSVMDAVRREQLEASDFTWIEQVEESVPMVADEAVISVLLHDTTEYRFSFDVRHERFWATFAPGRESPEENKSCYNWPEMLSLVHEWILYLKRETNAVLLPPPSTLVKTDVAALSMPKGGALPKSLIQPILGSVFIGHGRSPEWRKLKDFLSERLRLPWEEFNREPAAGLSTKERLKTMLNAACFAFVVMTAEKEFPNGENYARLNVIHEAGLFQGKLGFERAIILLEDGCAEFSNILGLTQIRFPPRKIETAFEEVRRVLERENII